MTTAKSAYPMQVDELLPRARELAAELGRTPSRNRLMDELKIGAPKARTILDLLRDEHTTSNSEGAARLHLVAEPAEPTGSVAVDGPALDTPSGSGPDEPTEPIAESEVVDVVPGPNPVDSSEQNTQSDPVSEPVTTPTDPVPPTRSARTGKQISPWPVLLLSLPAFVAIWSGWVGLGGLTGFGIVHPLPGIADGFALNTAITLPIGMETYAAYALRVWMSGQVPSRARRFAKWSALGSLLLGALGQIAYHLMKAAGMDAAPWPITALVACLPVAVLGMGAALAHLIKDNRPEVA
ncbi:ABC transporter permease [Saccharopolyspora shandongensis]|uniref:ABC transporter permease n=1 Tax=Saccharopolyspora shandongensis TaxID=418495 RepID=UPI0033F1EF1B